MKKCIYCGSEIPHESVVDFCERCGKSVWGDKMFNAIIENMENARDKGDLFINNPISETQNTDAEFENEFNR